jgi:hypothetical protein
LGARISPNGSCAKEKRYLRDCAESWADHIRTGRLPRSLSWKALLTTIMRSLLYPLPVTYFTRAECNYIMAPVLRVALSHSGVCRTIPRAIVYAPLQYQGLDIPDLYIEQGLFKITRLLKFGRASKSITSKLIRHSAEAMKMELGLNGNLLHHDPSQLEDLVSPSWMKSTWKFIAEHDIAVADDIPDFKYIRHHDRLLMDGFTAMGLTKTDLYKVNMCRMHLQAITIADITDGSGELITLNAWNGKRALPHTKRYNWGLQPSPPATFWTVWKKALKHLCGRERRLLQPLGHWTREGCEHWIWWFDEITESLFSRHAEGSFRYPDKSSRNTRQAAWRFNDRSKVPSDVPLSATPCTIVKQGQFLLYQGTAPMTDDQPTSATIALFPSFQSYLASMPSKDWVFKHIQFQGSCESIVQSIRHGTCSCITDGSFKDKHGTAAWKILDLDKPEHVMEGQVITPGFPHQQDAYRSELSGLYASVLAINALVTYYHVTEGAITLACDNISALRMASYDPLGTNPSCAQFDLVMAIQYLKTPLIDWIHKHVKGHQDDNPDLVLTPLELINVEMDTKAKSHWTATQAVSDEDRLHDIDGQPWSLSLGGHKVVSNLSTTCKDWCQRPRIHAYWIEKGRFQPEEINTIDF